MCEWPLINRCYNGYKSYHCILLFHMSDSDSIPGEVEYSDDEDYIRNESVISTHHPKKIDGSLLQQQQHHPQQSETKNQHNQSIHNRKQTHDHGNTEQQPSKPNQEPFLTLHQEKIEQKLEQSALPTQETERQQISERRGQDSINEQIMVSVTASALLNVNNTQEAIIQASPVRNQEEQQRSEYVEKKVGEVDNSEESNDDEDVYRETYVSEAIQQANQQPKQLKQAPEAQREFKENKDQPNIDQAAENARKIEVQLKIQKPAQDISSKLNIKQHMQPLIIPEVEKLQLQRQQKEEQQAQKAILKLQPSSNSHEQIQKQEEKLPNPAIKISSSSEQYTESERDLLVGMNVVAASSNSELSQRVVQRKLFKTDLQKEEEKVSGVVPYQNHSQQQPELLKEQRLPSQINSNSSTHELMTIPQKKTPPEELSASRKQQSAPSKSEACKCQIM